MDKPTPIKASKSEQNFELKPVIPSINPEGNCSAPPYSPSWWDFQLGLTNGQLDPSPSQRRSSLTLTQKILSHLKCLTVLLSPCCPNLWSRHDPNGSWSFRKSKKEKRQSYQISRIIMSSYSNATLDSMGNGTVGEQPQMPSPPSTPDSLDGGMGFETPIRPPKTSSGKLSPPSPPTPSVFSMFEHLKPKIMLKVQESYDTDADFMLTLLNYRKLIAIGISYFVKIKINEGPLCVHVRIYQHNDSDPEMKGVEIGKLEGEEIEYF